VDVEVDVFEGGDGELAGAVNLADAVQVEDGLGLVLHRFCVSL
jgi:hypothetical protein